MRRFEFLLLMALVPGVFVLIVRPTDQFGWQFWVLVTALLFLIVHITKEKHRWQMFPAYILLVLIFLFIVGSFFGFRVTALPTIWRILAALSGILLWFFAIMNAYTLAFFDRHLKNKPAPLLEGRSLLHYPEAIFELYE